MQLLLMSWQARSNCEWHCARFVTINVNRECDRGRILYTNSTAGVHLLSPSEAPPLRSCIVLVLIVQEVIQKLIYRKKTVGAIRQTVIDALFIEP